MLAPDRRTRTAPHGDALIDLRPQTLEEWARRFRLRSDRALLEAGLSEEGLELLREAEYRAMDRMLYGSSFVDAEGRRVDPLRVSGLEA